MNLPSVDLGEAWNELKRQNPSGVPQAYIEGLRHHVREYLVVAKKIKAACEEHLQQQIPVDVDLFAPLRAAIRETDAEIQKLAALLDELVASDSDLLA